MNAFYQHHKDNILFHYSCFDRILLNGLIQPFQQPERVVGFFSAYRNTYPVTRTLLRDMASQYHNGVQNLSRHWGAPVLEAPKHRRDEFIDPYFRKVKPDQIVAIIKAREPARILTSTGKQPTDGCHLELKYRCVDQYSFYLNDSSWGRMFVRVCPYFPFSARVCLNQHHWPVIRSHYKNGFIKQYVRDERILRTESATNDVYEDYGIGKAVENLPSLRQKLQRITQNYLDIQQDILVTFVDRGQLRQLSQPTVYPSGKRIPGLKLDAPRQLALMQALVRFSHVAAGATFTTVEIHSLVAGTLGTSTAKYRLSSLRYDLFKLRAKGLVKKIPHTRRYALLPKGYRICLVYLKLFKKLYAPLTAAIQKPFAADAVMPPGHHSDLDRLYCTVTQALDKLVDAVGLKAPYQQ